MKGTAQARKRNVDHDFVSRRSGRAVPETSVTVALLDDNVPVAYGIVRDLSEIGACIMTDTVLKPGSSFQFRRSGFGGDVLEAMAIVIWNDSPHSGGTVTSEVPHGLEFSEMNEAHLENLRRILGSTDFGAKKGH